MNKSNDFDLLKWIKPSITDPTFSILKIHLIIEELLNHHLHKNFKHPTYLDKARLSFNQTLLISKASCEKVSPDYWIWQSIDDLNKIRNKLAHESNPEKVKNLLIIYQDNIFKNTSFPNPQKSEAISINETMTLSKEENIYTTIDIANLFLYLDTAKSLDIDKDKIYRI